jgi:hypothetical protein
VETPDDGGKRFGHDSPVEKVLSGGGENLENGERFGNDENVVGLEEELQRLPRLVDERQQRVTINLAGNVRKVFRV